MIRFAFISLKLFKPRNVSIDRVHSNTFVRGIYLGSITGCILCLQVEGPINIWGVEGGGEGFIISDSIPVYGILLDEVYVGNSENSCQTSQNCMIIFQILSLEISTSQISTELEETQKNSEQINQTLTRTTTQVSYWFIHLFSSL